MYYATSDFSGPVSAKPGSGNGAETGQAPGTIGFFDTDDDSFRSGQTWRFQANDGPFDVSTYAIAASSTATAIGSA